MWDTLISSDAALQAMSSNKGKVKAKVEADVKKVEQDVKKVGSKVKSEAKKIKKK
jgi:hypothetical protein